MSINQQLLEAVKARGGSNDAFGCGILTADRYVKTLQECAGSDLCYRYAATRQESFDDVLRKAASTLVYRNQDMELSKETDPTLLHLKETSTATTVGVDFKADAVDGIELPKDTLVVFRHILTTPRKDRDGDVLRTQGAEVDPKMLLLWQHVHTLPIGKLVGVVQHTSKCLEVVSAIVDMNSLCHDAAVMVENDMARFSHGFRALEFERLKDENGKEIGGFDIKSFEIMEASVVSIPSNRDAETQEVLLSLVEGGKLTSPIMKEVGKTLRAQQPIQVTGIDADELSTEEQKQRECSCKTGASAEKDASAEETGQQEQEVPTAKDAEVDTKFYGHAAMTGSWEETRSCLDRQIGKYMQSSDMDMDDCFCYLTGTFDDHVVVCCEKYEYGADDEYSYCRISWSRENGMPRLTGDPVPVDVVVVEEEKQKLDATKQTRIAIRQLQQVEDADLNGFKIADLILQPKQTAEDAAALFLAESTKEHRERLSFALQAIAKAEEDEALASKYKALASTK